MDAVLRYLFIIITILLIAVELNGVTVKPSLCPTNKIAPHRRHIATYEQNNIRPRTFGLIHDFLGPNRLSGPPRPPRPLVDEPLDDLQEQPQEDDPDDCGEIDDYDETDLSSVTPAGQRRRTDRQNRFFDDYRPGYRPPPYNRPPSNNRPPPGYYPGQFGPQAPYQPPYRPPPPNRPSRPSQSGNRPQYGSTGNYGIYRPDSNPSNHVKPVTENTYEDPQAAYRPGLVGGFIGHIVGFAPIKPMASVGTNSETHANGVKFPEGDSYRRPKAKPSPDRRSTSIVGSFVDLLLNRK